MSGAGVRTFRSYADAIERWLRIDPEGPLDDLARARGIYVVGLTIVGLSIFNLLSLVISYGEWSFDATVCLVFGLVVAASIPIMRWTKPFGVYAIFYTLLSFAAVAGSALPLGLGINTALLPFLAIGPMIIGYIFNWRSAVFYGVFSGLFLIVLYAVSSGNQDFGRASQPMWLYQRFVQAEIALIVGTVVAVNFSINTFQSLGKLQKSVDRANEAEGAKSQFLATMSHELRTPLNGIIGMAEALCASNVTARERELAETIRRSGESLLVIIGDLLDLSKIEAGQLDLERRSFSIQNLARHVTDSWTETAANKGLTVRTKIYSGLPDAVMGDEHRIGQILQNLVSNAVKFTESGSVVLEVGAERPGDPVPLVIRVIDTGCGIPSELHEQIFETFRQGEHGTTRRFGGTGLGLPISRLLAGLMGGAITLERSDSEGSVFRFEVPLDVASTPAAPQSRPAELAPQPSLAGLHVLVAEDNEVNRLVMREYLTAWGISFTFAHDGVEAMEALEVDRFDLLLLDKHMPRMGGLDVAVKVRHSDNPNRTMPIIAVSADARPEEIEECFACGVDQFVPKPVRPAVLRETIERVLADRNAESGSAAS